MTNRPHLLLITTDQQRFDTIRALGFAHARTPHLDALCRTGVAFRSAYADCPVCIPSRTTIMTGLPAWAFGVPYYKDRAALPIDPATSLPGRLAAAGYETVAVGKMHFWPRRCRYGFQRMELPVDYLEDRVRRDGVVSPTWHGMGQNEIYPVPSAVPDPDSLTAWTVDRSIAAIERRDPTSPLFLWTSFTKPHPPFDPPEAWWSLFRGADLPSPAQGDWIDRHSCPLTANMDRRHHPRDFPTPAVLRQAKEAYLALIAQIDAHLGRLFARLMELKMWDDTCILFTSDHGELLGDHGGIGKSSWLEGSSHIPFIVKPHRGMPAPRRREIPTPVGLADVASTLLAAADLPAQGTGEDAWTFATAAEPIPRTVVGEYGDIWGGDGRYRSRWHGVTDGRWKYTWLADGGTDLLFDLVSDPTESCDLSGKEPAQRARLRRIVEESLRARNHPDVGPEGCIARPPIQLAAEANWITNGWHSPAFDVDVIH